MYNIIFVYIILDIIIFKKNQYFKNCSQQSIKKLNMKLRLNTDKETFVCFLDSFIKKSLFFN